MRLDLFLVNNNKIESRNKAMSIIKSDNVKVNNIICNKANYLVKENDIVTIDNNLEFVSRGGVKLEFAINNFNINFKDKVILDIGSSTGGFSDCALKYNAKKIYCVDVGENQLHPKIKNNIKVIDLSPINIKNINKSIIKDKIDIIISDLSFISSIYMFESITKLNLDKNVNIISLIKPQFELGKEKLDKTKGLIKNKIDHDKAISNVVSYAKNNNFKVIRIIDSPIKGAKKSNKEFLG